METLRFKTNIKCSGCIATVTPALNTLPGLQTWRVDLDSANKTLTVEGKEGLTPEAVKNALQKVGYQGETID